MCHGNHQNVMIHTVDTDVVVLVLSTLHDIPFVSEVWISFGVGKNHRFIPAHEIAANLGPHKASALGMFHAFTGCDNISFFNGKGKRTAWDTWSVYPEFTDALLQLSKAPSHIPDDTFEILERFVVLMYDRTSNVCKANEARQHLFARRSKALKNIPPPKDAT